MSDKELLQLREAIVKRETALREVAARGSRTHEEYQRMMVRAEFLRDLDVVLELFQTMRITDV